MAHYRIEVGRPVSAELVARLEGGWSIVNEEEGEGSVLVGEIADQADLFAVLLQLQQLGIALVLVGPAGRGSL